MKKTLVFGLLILSLLGFSKCQSAKFYFKISNDTSKTGVIKWNWAINGENLSNPNKEYKVRIHYPKLDTLVLNSDNGKKRIILTRFTPNHTYQLRSNGCCNDIEVFDDKKINQYESYLMRIANSNSDIKTDWEKLDSIYKFQEIGNVKVKLVNSKTEDVIGATFGDIDRWVNMTGGKVLTENKTIEINEPFMTGESNLCFEIVIGKVEYLDSNQLNNDSSSLVFLDAKGLSYKFMEQIVHFEIRFLNLETLFITYDAKKESVSLEIE